MKALITVSLMTLTIIMFASCGGNHQEHSLENDYEKMESVTFQCPMKCEGDKTYDEPGICPVCKMDLENLEDRDNHNNNHHHHQ